MVFDKVLNSTNDIQEALIEWSNIDQVALVILSALE